MRPLRDGGAPRSGYGASGTVGEIIYQGNNVRIGNRLQPDVTFWAEVRDHEFDDLSVGDPLAVGWPEEAAIILGEDA